ncbi:MAG: hypothetical protein EOO24_67260 [Comamonadaceae bacterium]|nr:MAG: hypothetical protein EOO24_67260 [Comamonadaceae bacterium]
MCCQRGMAATMAAGKGGGSCVRRHSSRTADKALAQNLLLPLHRGSAFLMAGLVVAHAAGALKHHWVDRDGLLARMWP